MYAVEFVCRVHTYYNPVYKIVEEWKGEKCCKLIKIANLENACEYIKQNLYRDGDRMCNFCSSVRSCKFAQEWFAEGFRINCLLGQLSHGGACHYCSNFCALGKKLVRLYKPAKFYYNVKTGNIIMAPRKVGKDWKLLSFKKPKKPFLILKDKQGYYKALKNIPARVYKILLKTPNVNYEDAAALVTLYFILQPKVKELEKVWLNRFNLELNLLQKVEERLKENATLIKYVLKLEKLLNKDILSNLSPDVLSEVIIWTLKY